MPRCSNDVANAMTLFASAALADDLPSGQPDAANSEALQPCDATMSRTAGQRGALSQALSDFVSGGGYSAGSAHVVDASDDK